MRNPNTDDARYIELTQMALEAGNSPRVVFSNYRELVWPADAVKWLGIAPGEDEKAIQLLTAVM